MARPVKRSRLMMPINNPRFVSSSWLRNSDSLEYDLEDAVPQAQKAYARSLVRDAISIGLRGGADIGVRINCAYVEADVEASVWPGLSLIAHPKTEDPEQIKKVDELATRFEHERGIRPGTVEITAMIETARGVANGYEIASASPRVRAFGGGGGYDMSLDLGVEMFVGFDQFFYGTSECELIARALGLQYDVHVFVSDTRGSVSDAEGTYLRAVANRKAGGRSGFGLHPNVVEPQNRGYTPTPEEVEQAQRILAFYRELDQRGEVAGELGGQRVDVHEAARAEELMEWADACARKDAHKARARAQAEAVEAS